MNQRLAVLFVCAASACGNVSGHVSATRTGDTSHPATRSSPVETVRSACGDDAPITAVLAREPYLQQVTSDSAMLGWVSSTPTDENMAVTLPEGSLVQAVAGAIDSDQGTLRSASDKQMWSSIAKLEPSTIYCYQVAHATDMMTSRTGFKTAPAADSTDPVRFIAFGDSGGGGADQYALLEQMYTVAYDLIIHTGDLAYDNGSMAQYDDNVFGVYADLFRNIPFFPAPGNHDYKTLGGAPFREVFNLPGDSGEKWYSYNWGRVHFVALDTEADYATQARWLDADLAATDRPWKIVYMHKPPYSSGAHSSDLALRNALAPLLHKYHVQLVLSGHDHDYERMTPQDGVAYVVTGGGGVGTKSVGTSSFTAFSEDVIHFVYVEVGVDELVLHAIDASGREFDSMVVPRES